uniref:Uncharacterized protein n=1 Tax=Arundo donax TaxID=35708 RepID=A0A0A9AEN8_ARUDO
MENRYMCISIAGLSIPLLWMAARLDQSCSAVTCAGAAPLHLI